MTAIFAAKAPGIMRMLMADFGLTVEDAAAILGNLGHESGGFKFLQEIKPLVPGSRGGYGWAQWTGPRRVEFEAYCQRNGLEPASDKANYGFLFVELTTTEAKAIPAVKAAVGLAAKVRAFEAAFERAGVKHYPSREQWAARALAAFAAAGQQPAAPPAKPPVISDNGAKIGAGGAVGGGAIIGAGKAVEAGWSVIDIVLTAGIAVGLVACAWMLWRFWKLTATPSVDPRRPIVLRPEWKYSAKTTTESPATPPPTGDPVGWRRGRASQARIDEAIGTLATLDDEELSEGLRKAIDQTRAEIKKAMDKIPPIKMRARKPPAATTKPAAKAKPAAKKRRA